MGEYVKLDGEVMKLGTCEDLYYARFENCQQQLHRAEKQDGNLDPLEYLNPKYGWRYRFPFPEEDGLGFGNYDEYDKGRSVGVPGDSPAVLPPNGHGNYTHGFSVKSGGYQVNLAIPCPASGKLAEMGLKASPIGKCPVEIVQQKLLADGERAVIVRCGWCGAKYHLIEKEAQWFVSYIRSHYAADNTAANTAYYTKLADRIEAGYRTAVES